MVSVVIINDDALARFEMLQPQTFDCAVVDPPYGETSLAWDRWVPEWPKLLRPLLKRTGSMWVFGSQRMFLEHAADFSGWRLAQDVVWEKHNGTGLFNDRFRRVHENVLHFYRDDAAWADVYKAPQFTNDASARTVRKKGRPAQWIGATGETVYRSEDGGPRLMRSVIYARSEHGRAIHPTQKPLAVVEPLLLYSCPPGGHVLDPFAGSGTVGIAAQRHRMRATLIEARRDYAESAQRRLANDAPLFADTYNPSANLAGGYAVAIEGTRKRFEAAKRERPDLTAEQFAREQGGAYLGGGR